MLDVQRDAECEDAKAGELADCACVAELNLILLFFIQTGRYWRGGKRRLQDGGPGSKRHGVFLRPSGRISRRWRSKSSQ